MSLNRLVTRAATLDGRGVSSYRKQGVSKRRVRERWKPQVSLEERTSAITESLTDSPILSLLTYVQPPSNPWSCLNCKTKDMWQSCGKKQPLHQESEVLQMQMQPEQQLRCEYLLLKVYQCSESTAFASKPHYGTQPCQGTQGPVLDEIKKKLRSQVYSHVGGFVQDMRLIFQNLKAFCSDGVFLSELEAKFEKNFQCIFAVQETGQSMS